MIFDKSVICPIFIGRENDLQLLDRLINQSNNRSGQIALISDEAGIGKSRFVREAKVRAPESFEAARDERLKVSGNPSQYNDLTPFIHEQELMRELIGKSKLPSLTLDISDNNIPAAVERVANWLEQSSGLYMPDY